MLVDGRAGEAMADLFIDRWRASGGDAIERPTRPEETPWPDGLLPDLRRTPVAIARTSAAWQGRPEVTECMLLHLSAIRRAKRLIYLENQYVTSPVLVEALAERLAEPDGPEVVTIGPARSPSYFDQMTMDSARTAAINRLREVDIHRRFSAFSAHTPKGGPIIVHSKVSIIDDEMLRIGSANLNNRSIGLDSECDLAFEARDDRERETIRGFLGRLVGHFIDRSTLDVLEAMELQGGLAAAINALDVRGGPPRRLQPVPVRKLSVVEQFIADWSLGDAIAPDDAWRPWGRRKRLQRDIARLTAPPPLPPDHLRP
jgi:phosphatidylserine/phosphatidylglycerophosphate/cardiolipin synthase-like enzyme